MQGAATQDKWAPDDFRVGATFQMRKQRGIDVASQLPREAAELRHRAIVLKQPIL